MESLKIIKHFVDELNKRGQSSFPSFRKLKESGVLDLVIDTTDFRELFKVEITNYLDYLFDDNCYHYSKKIDLYENYNIFNIDILSYYIISLYIDSDIKYRNESRANEYDPEAYKDMGVFLKKIIDDLDIDKYKDKSILDIDMKLRESYDIDDKYDINLEKYVFENLKKEKQKYTNYDKYDEDFKKNILDIVEDTTSFFVCAEHQAYEKEKEKLSQYPELQEKVKWVSRNHADGYGFDILSFNSNSGKEMLIEVKTSKRFKFKITGNELNTMRNSDYYNSEYYIYFYCYDCFEDEVRLTRYKYIKEFDKMIDQDGNLYDIDINFVEDDNSKVEASLVPSKEKLLKYC